MWIYSQYDILYLSKIFILKKVKFIKKYRNEWKYCCTESDLEMIGSRLAAVLGKDSHSGLDKKYAVHSLYFDDYKDTCVKENDAGIAKRLKYRIRYYGSNCDFMNLECKTKVNGRCYKEICRISMEEYQKLVDGDIDELLWNTDKPLIQSYCLKCRMRHFEPKAIIDYERIAFVEEITHVRITLDKNITVSGKTNHFLDRDYIPYPIQTKGQHVLEVKFDYILPGYLKHIITDQHLIQSSYSKYSLGRKKLQSMGQEIIK
ncbi:MAG: polyphosphate polymerase domain-containing protein [Lachnospiraceae bacterium]|nr:polyphosphate polymerase domain-containing protein [Lachnospiraceae bacterium]